VTWQTIEDVDNSEYRSMNMRISEYQKEENEDMRMNERMREDVRD
jgi:hypothetical protein